MTFPCPHTRELTDAELDRIAAHGLEDWKRVQREKKRQQDQPLEGDEWKDGQ
jgi:hypothetical protein